jgi:AraC family transcriptional regulator
MSVQQMSPSHTAAIHRAIALMREDLASPTRIDDLARVAHFSKFHFIVVFTKAMGLSPGRYLTRLRMEAATELLATTDLNVAHVCTAVGFESVGTFSRRFRRHAGCSPSEYRRRAREAGAR